MTRLVIQLLLAKPYYPILLRAGQDHQCDVLITRRTYVTCWVCMLKPPESGRVSNKHACIHICMLKSIHINKVRLPTNTSFGKKIAEVQCMILFFPLLPSIRSCHLEGNWYQSRCKGSWVLVLGKKAPTCMHMPNKISSLNRTCTQQINFKHFFRVISWW